ncbi:Protein IQ-DOMAIN 1 [Dissostichus eleginoides]|uniref:Protein IQ-DOMAIN 1 n=1 Tax=Dissostichus eleginoides TaxID=100907 RepID=A0AAD9CFK3_DISEL|nr:Protein IQ-DOMAIN 1 [Dissostichus eleginoides]
MPGMTGAKNVHSGMRPPEVKNVAAKKGNKTAEKTEGKVDKGPEKKDNKEEKAGEKKNTGGEASKGGNRDELNHGAKPPAAGAAAAENLGMGNGEEKQKGEEEEPASDEHIEAEEGSLLGYSSDEDEVLRRERPHGENGDGRQNGTGEDEGDGGNGAAEEEGPAEETSKAGKSKKRKEKRRVWKGGQWKCKRRQRRERRYRKHRRWRGEVVKELDGKRSEAEASEGAAWVREGEEGSTVNGSPEIRVRRRLRLHRGVGVVRRGVHGVRLT